MNVIAPEAVVISVNRDGAHRFSKQPHGQVTLLAGIGIEGDAHSGVTVQHMSRLGDPDRPNLRQVHLIHSELFDEVAEAGFSVMPGDMGENITTTGIDLLALPQGTILRLGADAAVQVTGLRNPCAQINTFQPGLMKAVLGRDENGDVVRKAGVMSIVLAGGIVEPGDSVTVELPAEPHLPLAPV
ncbi:MOSC domain-containing protein [Leifsonia sp. A12D58]|uniref:MOSC domain-containing protein n=1 Tax=Leifsonia sp. A12D58 TaxID=3397674 RepID=UPI0039E1CDD2